MRETPLIDSKMQQSPRRKYFWPALFGLFAIILSAYGLFLSVHEHHAEHHLASQMWAMETQLQQQAEDIKVLEQHTMELLKASQQAQDPLFHQILNWVYLANLYATTHQDTLFALQALKQAEQTTLLWNSSQKSILLQSIRQDLYHLGKEQNFSKTALIEQLDQLNHLLQSLPYPYRATFQPKPSPATTDHTQNPHHLYAQILEILKQLRYLVLIEHHRALSGPLLTPPENSFLKENIQTKLFQAEWAVLQNKPLLYQSALLVVEVWVNRYYALSPALPSLQKYFQQLKTISLPTESHISLHTLQTLEALKNTAQ